MSQFDQDSAVIHGDVSPEFEPVKVAFTRNFADRYHGEIGAACAVYFKGQKVVDLWGGRQAPFIESPWTEDTLAPVFSTTKGLAAMAVAMAHSRGWIRFDEPVAEYWPEFAQSGKSRITVRQLLAHQAGLCAMDEALSLPLLTDLDALAKVLARQKPAWKPGSCQGYHPITIGLYQNELIRRVDPRRRSLGRFFAEEVAEPLALEAYIGLPDHIPESRLAKFKTAGWLDALEDVGAVGLQFLLTAMWPFGLVRRTFSNPKVRNIHEFVSRKWLAVELPAGNGVCSARAIAKVYGEFATGGRVLGLRAETLDELEAKPSPPWLGCNDVVLKRETSFSLGFWKPCARLPFSRSLRAYGTPGAGGSMGFADPETGIGFAYVPNRLGLHMGNDPREAALRTAVYECALRASTMLAEKYSLRGMRGNALTANVVAA